MSTAQAAHATSRTVVGLLAGTLAALVVLTSGPAQAAPVTVAARNYEFQPPTRTIAVGDLVRWTFSGEPHSVTSRDGLFDSGVTNPGGSFQFQFTSPGTYPYYCRVHPEQMFGAIVVQSASATPTPTIVPTPRSTPTVTVKPTVKQRSTPTPTPTPTPVITARPRQSAVPSLSIAPSESAAASLAQVEAPALSSVEASPNPGDPGTTRTPDSAPMLLVAIVLAAAAVGGLVVARSRRAE